MLGDSLAERSSSDESEFGIMIPFGGRLHVRHQPPRSERSYRVTITATSEMVRGRPPKRGRLTPREEIISFHATLHAASLHVLIGADRDHQCQTCS